MATHPFTIDEVHEPDEDGGDLLGYDIHGHLTPEQVDVVLSEFDLHNDDHDEDVPFGFDVTHQWRTSITITDDDGDPIGFTEWHYADTETDDSIPVTHLLIWSSWGWWCHHHPHEPATTGIPADRIIDGARIIGEAAAAHAASNDPEARRTARPDRHGGYLYMCGECANDFSVRWSAQREALVR